MSLSLSTLTFRTAYRVGSFEELKELHARAVSAGPSAALRKDLSYEAHGKTNFKTEHGWFRSQDIEALIKFLEASEPIIHKLVFQMHSEHLPKNI